MICSQKERQEQRQEQRQEEGRKHQAAEAQAQLQRQLRKQKQKEERRKSLTGTVAPLRVALASQADTKAMPLFPGDQKEAQVLLFQCKLRDRACSALMRMQVLHMPHVYPVLCHTWSTERS